MSYVTMEDHYVEFSLIETGKKISVKSRYVNSVEQMDNGTRLTTASGESYTVSADYEEVLPRLIQSSDQRIRKAYSLDDAIEATRREHSRPSFSKSGPQPQ